MRTFVWIAIFLFSVELGYSQMWNGVDTLYGNEWIDFDQNYFKIKVGEDGIYRIDYFSLINNAIPVYNIQPDQYRLYRMGEEVPIYINTDAPLGSEDFIEFYGEKHRSELDAYLFKDPANEILNPEYSLFNDTIAYFLTWVDESGVPGQRYSTIENDLNNLPEKENWFWHTELTNFTNKISKKQNSSGISRSTFDLAEGFAKGFKNSENFELQAPFYAPGVDSIRLNIRLASNENPHQINIDINGVSQVSDNFFGFDAKAYAFSTWSLDSFPDLQTTISEGESVNGRFSVANIKVRYPRYYDFGGVNAFKFNIAGNGQRRYFEIDGFEGANPVLYDLTNRVRLEALKQGDKVLFAIPTSFQMHELYLWNDGSNGVNALPAFESVTFIDYSDANASYLIISNALLFDDGNGNNYVQEYADYRSSFAGGNYSTTIIEVQQIYDQFGYGIDRHNLAIRNLGHYAVKNWDNAHYALLLGKGIEYAEIRTKAQVETLLGNEFFIPTFGYPGGDQLIFSDNYTSEPVFAMGRVAATSPEEIRVYLDKVIDFEANSSLPQSIEERRWMKRFIHLGGGDPTIQGIIKNHLIAIENKIEDNRFGAEVFSFYKTSSEPIQISASEQILNLINTGVSAITFFGHSGQNAFDFSLDSPENYDNEGKYPFIISLGCFSGQIHSDNEGISERFIFEEKKGAIGFLASTHLSYLSALRVISEQLYENLGGESYSQGIGDALKATIRILEENPAVGVEELTQHYTLHGDPAVAMNPMPGPDFVVDRETVQFNPQKVSIEQDSFQLTFGIQNIGESVKDSITIEITQKFPAGDELLIIREKVAVPSYFSEFTYSIPTYGEATVGLNRFFIQIDTEDQVEELPGPEAELNNSLVDVQGAAGIDLFITSNSLSPISPPQYGVINTPDIVLKASTNNPTSANQRYVIQIDTSELFNSPFLQETMIEQSGGVVQWKPSIAPADSTVYYWRTSPDSIDQTGYIWANSSFVWLSEEDRGWNQSHYFQFQDAAFTNKQLEASSRRMEYLDDFKDIRIIQGVYPTIKPEIGINNKPNAYIPWDGPIRGGVIIAVLDSITVDPWKNDASQLGLYGSNIPSWASAYQAFPYNTQSLEKRQLAMNLLDTIVPSGNYVVFITIQELNHNYEPEEWAEDSLATGGTNLFNILEGQGASMIRSTAESGAIPYYFIYKKDDPSFVPIEGFGNLESGTTINVSIEGSWDSGNVESTWIGPSTEWKSLHWNLDDFDPTSDRASLDVYGIRADSTESLLLTNIAARDTSIEFIDPVEYPYVRLQLNTVDTTFRSAPQLDYWRVLFKGLPEMAINANALFELDSDTLQQGDPMQVRIAMENIGDYPMDSLLVHYKLSDVSNNEQIFTDRIAPLEVSDTLIAEFAFDTKALSGKQQLVIEANPLEDQPERFHFNNTLITEFFVEGDERNPVLDVTFDGMRIMDGDLVSANPLINILLKDENPFLPLSDTSLINIFLKYPDDPTLRPIAIDDPRVTFFPASLNSLEKSNQAMVEFKPELEQSGEYQLIVQAEDVTGNQSGRFDYKVSFEIVKESLISNVFNYPNPFSTSTRFVYTLTGGSPITDVKIQIMTVSGRIVREILSDELGIWTPGTHQTDFVWDGTDQFGDRLANGVYLYRVFIQDEDGNDLEKYELEAETDQFFTNGLGKLVILR